MQKWVQMDTLFDFFTGGLLGGMIEKYFGVDKGLLGFFRPIYGCGAALSTESFMKNFVILSVLEAYAGLVYNTDNKLWDYSKYQDAIGSWSPINCLGFALAATVYHKVKNAFI